MEKQKCTLFKSENITVKISNLTLVNEVSFEVNENDKLIIIGPNGAGKSTLIRALAQGLPYKGKAYLRGKDLAKMKQIEIARSIGVLAQSHNINYSFTVEEIVSLGRYAYSQGLLMKNKDDKQYIEEALEMTGLSDKRNQSVLTLSGGEIQRTFLAQVFAQNPEILILDEPTNHLDIQYQKQVFELIEKWMKNNGKSVIAVVHDLSLASFFGNQFLLMNKGNVIAEGTDKEVLIPEKLNNVYGMNVCEWMNTLYNQWESI